MDNFYLSYHSVGIFLVFLIAFIQTVFLFIKKDKKPASFWLMGLFAGFSIMLFGYFLAYSFYSPTAAYHRYLTVFVLFANANMSGFAYFFPRDDFSHERHYAVPVAFLVAIIAYLHFIYKTNNDSLLHPNDLKDHERSKTQIINMYNKLTSIVPFHSTVL